mmetsp:Transcript_29680/g.71856  ORF Transcript_29680/g.71856 Transcript_29680/m.71856 type:complete len:81 (+) Transcript_29680:1085-1327(+)
MDCGWHHADFCCHCMVCEKEEEKRIKNAAPCVHYETNVYIPTSSAQLHNDDSHFEEIGRTFRVYGLTVNCLQNEMKRNYR